MKRGYSSIFSVFTASAKSINEQFNRNCLSAFLTGCKVFIVWPAIKKTIPTNAPTTKVGCAYAVCDGDENPDDPRIELTSYYAEP
ncbi:hypothetical protein KIN20_024911 [Parelaphostrongylus tenuis]|uniref:Uncharacterized protein n=1 Tax=Parelaphostrongylus tenuis TaxID=148309 RepID=A0AAD5NAC8_PARTN|nr:hypothetical protein KIN20_024911 [Parelaphostrongylus tenuis]